MESCFWKAAFPVYTSTFHYLFWDCEWNPEDAETFLEQLIKCIAMGYAEQEYFEWIHQSFDENGIRLTKKMKKTLRKFREEFPSAALKGFTWGEYEKDRKEEFHQLSLFDGELPFQ